MKHFIVFLFGCIIFNYSYSQTWETDLARVQSDGSLTYQEDSERNRIPDFSNAGYKGGGVSIPSVETRLTISPIDGDNTQHIQDAIDAVSGMELDSGGFRGAVLLEGGRYPVSGQIYVHTSGVVLRGYSDGRDSQDTTIIYGTGNIPVQRDLIILGGGDETRWRGEVSGSRQDITTDFVQVGSHSFTIENASEYAIGDNIIITHPCSAGWLEAIDGGGTDDDASWSENSQPIIYNRYITAITNNTITIDAPVYNHLDKSLSQSYVYKYDRAGLVTQVGIENINVQIESLGGEDEDHIWNAIQFTQVEDAWAINSTASGFGLSGIRTSTASRISIVNVHCIDPVAIVAGARMYNFNTYRNSNGILFDNCYARNGRHHYVSNGTASASGIVVLRSISEHPKSTSEGHRQWSTGMLFDNLIDRGALPSNETILGFYNRGDYGTGHGWSAAHSVMWNCEADRQGADGAYIIEKPPTAQNYAIGCKGNLDITGPFNQPLGNIEGSNRNDQLLPISLYEAQLLDRAGTVLSDFEASAAVVAPDEVLTFTAKVQGEVVDYEWDFGSDATPAIMSGPGPHDVSYTSTGLKSVTLTVSNGTSLHIETKSAYIEVRNEALVANEDSISIVQNTPITYPILTNDLFPPESESMSFLFDGIDDYVVYESDRILQEYPFTMMAWINTSATTDQTLLYIGNANSNVTGNILSINGGKVMLGAGVWTGSSNNESITSDQTVNDGTWHHITGVFASPTERHLYINGILAATDNNALENISSRLWRFSVGNRIDAAPDGDWFQGEIDEVRIYNSVLSDSDIKEVMSGSTCNNLETLLYWNFGGQASDLVFDQFNFLDGVNYGATSKESTLSAGALQATITSTPNHGTAYISDDLELVYTPEPGFVGLDSLSYRLNSGDCNSSMANVIFQVLLTSSSEELYSEDIIVYPNPTKGIVHIDSDTVKSFKIFSIGGNLLTQEDNLHQLDLSIYQDGIYLIYLEAFDGRQYMHRIIKY